MPRHPRSKPFGNCCASSHGASTHCNPYNQCSLRRAAAPQGIQQLVDATVGGAVVMPASCLAQYSGNGIVLQVVGDVRMAVRGRLIPATACRCQSRCACTPAGGMRVALNCVETIGVPSNHATCRCL